MICDNCGTHFDPPSFGPIGKDWCWTCYSGEVLPEDEQRDKEGAIAMSFATVRCHWRWDDYAMPAQEARCTK